MLALQFGLGMALNLLDGGTVGAAHITYSVVLVLHIVNAIGLVEGGTYIALKERSVLSWRAALAVCVTFCAGVLTVLTRQDIWSFAMACGFLASAWLNVALYVRADRACRDSNPADEKKAA